LVDHRSRLVQPAHLRRRGDRRRGRTRPLDGALGVSAVASLRLVVDDVSKSFGDTTALRGLSLEAAGGEVLGIAGPNGAGKTTLVRIIAGEDDADAGTVTLGERTQIGRASCRERV